MEVSGDYQQTLTLREVSRKDESTLLCLKCGWRKSSNAFVCSVFPSREKQLFFDLMWCCSSALLI
jgi:hypothetical protein